MDLKVEEKDSRLYQLMSFFSRDIKGTEREPSDLASEYSRGVFHQIVQILFSKDSKIQKFEDTSYDLFSFAASAGYTSIVKILLEKGANPHGKREDCRPLSMAVFNGHPLVVKMLLEKGASPEEGGNVRETPLETAALEGNTAIARILLEHGANPNREDAKSSLPLSGAAMLGYTPMVKLLLESGANPDKTTTEYPDTPLALAAENGYIWIVQLLLEHGAAVEGSRRSARPLALAIKSGYEPIVELLLEKGARMTLSDKLLRKSPIYAPPRRNLPAFHQNHCHCDTDVYYKFCDLKKRHIYSSYT